VAARALFADPGETFLRSIKHASGACDRKSRSLTGSGPFKRGATREVASDYPWGAGRGKEGNPTSGGKGSLAISKRGNFCHREEEKGMLQLYSKKTYQETRARVGLGPGPAGEDTPLPEKAPAVQREKDRKKKSFLKTGFRKEGGSPYVPAPVTTPQRYDGRSQSWKRQRRQVKAAQKK